MSAWRFIWLENGLVYEHTSHVNLGNSDMCWYMWAFRWSDRLPLYAQYSHAYGRSPVCVLACTSYCAFHFVWYEQTGQENMGTSTMVGGGRTSTRAASSAGTDPLKKCYVFVTSACARRTGAAARVEQRHVGAKHCLQRKAGELAGVTRARQVRPLSAGTTH